MKKCSKEGEKKQEKDKEDSSLDDDESSLGINYVDLKMFSSDDR